MPRRVCFYGELDPFTGSIPQSVDAFSYLLKELKIACLIYDEVLISDDVIFNHVLTLPAIETLEPFIKSGLLRIVSEKNYECLGDHIKNRVDYLYGKNLKQGISRRGRNHILLAIDHWKSLAPSILSFSENIYQQHINTIQCVKTSLLRLTNLSKQAKEARKQLIDLVLFMEAKGAFNRNEIMSRLGEMCGLLATRELIQFIVIIQGEYLHQCVRNLNDQGYIDVSLFSGKFIHLLHRYRFLFQDRLLPVDMNNVKKMENMLTRSGFSWQELTRLCASDLCQLLKSGDWKLWRSYMLSENYSTKMIKEINVLKISHRNICKKISLLLKKNDSMDCNKLVKAPLSLIAPTPWFSAGLGLSGNIVSTILDSNKKKRGVVNCKFTSG